MDAWLVLSGGVLGSSTGAGAVVWFLLKRYFKAVDKIDARLAKVEKIQLLLIQTLRLTFEDFERNWKNKPEVNNVKI